jgi:hypothetical protein
MYRSNWLADNISNSSNLVKNRPIAVLENVIKHSQWVNFPWYLTSAVLMDNIVREVYLKTALYCLFHSQIEINLTFWPTFIYCFGWRVITSTSFRIFKFWKLHCVPLLMDCPDYTRKILQVFLGWVTTPVRIYPKNGGNPDFLFFIFYVRFF